jgi:hypothetical protein
VGAASGRGCPCRRKWSVLAVGRARGAACRRAVYPQGPAAVAGARWSPTTGGWWRRPGCSASLPSRREPSFRPDLPLRVSEGCPRSGRLTMVAGSLARTLVVTASGQLSGTAGRGRRPHGHAVRCARARARIGATRRRGPSGRAGKEAARGPSALVASEVGPGPAVLPGFGEGGHWCGGHWGRGGRVADAWVVGEGAVAGGRHHGASGAGGVRGAVVGASGTARRVAAAIGRRVRAVPVPRAGAVVGGWSGALAVDGAGVGGDRVQGGRDQLVPGAAAGGGVPCPVDGAGAQGGWAGCGAVALCLQSVRRGGDPGDVRHRLGVAPVRRRANGAGARRDAARGRQPAAPVDARHGRGAGGGAHQPCDLGDRPGRAADDHPADPAGDRPGHGRRGPPPTHHDRPGHGGWPGSGWCRYSHTGTCTAC